MLRSARMAAMTGCAAAFDMAAKVRLGPIVSLDISGVSGSAKLFQKRSFLARLEPFNKRSFWESDANV